LNPQKQIAVSQNVLPYHEYSDEDIAHRFIYVEVSGCPFKCEFYLSALNRQDRQAL